MKSNSFARQLLHLSTGAAINMIIGVLTTPVITRLVDPNEYGQLNLFNTYSSIALMFFTLGLDQAFVRYFYITDSKEAKRWLLAYCAGLPAALAVVGSFALFLLHLFIPNMLGFDNFTLLCFIANFYILILNRFGLLVLRLQYKTALYSVMNIVHKVLYVAIVIPFALIFKGSHLHVLLAATLLSVFVSAVLSVISERRFWFNRIINYKSRITRKELLKYGIPLMISSGIFILFQATDRLCIKYYGTYSDVGVYSSAQSLMAVFAIIQTTFNTLWAPKAIDHYEKNPEDRNFYIKMNQIITFVMFVFGSCVLLGKDLFVLLLGEKYRAASSIIPFLLFNPMMYTISETTVTGISITKHTQSQVIITCVSALANFIGNMLLIPILGSKGAAVSTGLSYIILFTMRTLISNHYFPVDFKLKRFYLVTAVFAAGSWYHMTHTFDIIIVGFFAGTIGLLCFLYHDALKSIISICKKQFRRIA